MNSYVIELTETELNLAWGALNTCTINGKDAPVLFAVMTKFQLASNSPKKQPDPVQPVTEDTENPNVQDCVEPAK